MRRLVGNFGRWHERNSGAGSPYTGLYGGLVLLSRLRENDPGHSAVSFTHVDAGLPDAERLLERYVTAVAEGVGVTPYVPGTVRVPWFTATTQLTEAQDAEKGRQKIKSAYLRRSLTDRQIDALFTHLDSADHSSEAASVSLQSYGGRINTVGSSATATAHRDAVVNVIFMNTWQDPDADAENIGW
ncbi:FAD-linked oxidase, partial [Streptomyces sp. TRM76130]|nr:FAD-linked oxidase [Streptomyces sp. TRM76130]